MPDDHPAASESMELPAEVRWQILALDQGRALSELGPAAAAALRAQAAEAERRTELWRAIAGVCRARGVQLAVAIGTTSLLLGLTAWLFRWDPVPVLDAAVVAWRGCPDTDAPPDDPE